MKYVKFGGPALKAGQHTWFKKADTGAIVYAYPGQLVPASDMEKPDYFVAADMASFKETDIAPAVPEPTPDNSVPGGLRFVSDAAHDQIKAEKEGAAKPAHAAPAHEPTPTDVPPAT